MNKFYFNELLQKLNDGSITPAERSLLESWYNQYSGQSSDSMGDDDVESSVSALRNKLQLDHKPLIKKLWPKIAVAVAIAFMVVGAYFFRSTFTKTDNDNTVLVASDIAPGKNGATLTLANGTKIFVNDALTGNIAKQSGVKITKTSDGQIIYEVTDQGTGKTEYNTLTTTRGEQTQVRLPDGSLVFLNAASSLRYPTSFAKSAKRSVSLTGEGYFEIAKNKAQPFVVTAAGQQEEVLGTRFNINAYADEKAVRTTLLEGSVKVNAGSRIQTIKPGEQVVNIGAELKVLKVDTQIATDWKDGAFNLDEVDFRAAMREIARWYDVDIVYDDTVPQDIEAWGWISRNSKLSSVLKLIENSGQVKFRLEGKKLYVYK